MATISYVERNLQAESVAGIIFFLSLAMVFLLAMILVLLMFRKTRLWYWKTDQQLKALQDIDITLAEIKQGVDNVHKSVESLTKTEIDKECSTEEVDNSDDIEDKPDAEPEQNESEKMETVCDGCQENIEDVTKAESQNKLGHKRGPNVGKSGTVYEDDVLRQQIQY